MADQTSSSDTAPPKATILKQKREMNRIVLANQSLFGRMGVSNEDKRQLKQFSLEQLKEADEWLKRKEAAEIEEREKKTEAEVGVGESEDVEMQHVEMTDV